MRRHAILLAGVVLCLIAGAPVRGDVGDPQVGTDHPWYPGELACSTFPRLFATQAALYQRVVGIRPETDEHRALASWLWRNTHYCHGEEGADDIWGKGFTQGGDLRGREYWTGLFAHGFGLCGTTHSQWVAEFEALLGHSRGRSTGTAGHVAFEAFLSGGPYGSGKWVLLDHDLSTVIFDPEGVGLLGLADIQRQWQRLTDRSFLPQRQRGWLLCGLHPNDGSSYARYTTAEYLSGYAGPPPMVHLRRGETLRRYLRPGLEDGQSFVFWGRNYNTGGIPGPERSLTWVNQPERLYGARDGAGHRPGQARYGNAVYTYQPDFSSGDYREALHAEGDDHVVFRWTSPYVIAATPPNGKPWGIYEPGCRNGLVLRGRANCAVSVSTDRGRTWRPCGRLVDGLDLTDHVKGCRQYLLRLDAGAKALANTGLILTTVCQANPAILPRLQDNGTEVRFETSGRAVVSAGPRRAQAEPHLVEGAFGTPHVTLELATPQGEPVLEVHAAAHVLSGNPPDPAVKYQIEYSPDAGTTWKPLVKDWTITRRGDEPKDFWSQSLCWGSAVLDGQASRVRVRFRNDGRRSYARCELHLVHRVRGRDGTRVTFDWTESGGSRREGHVFPAGGGTWRVRTGQQVRTHWVEFEPVRSP